MQPLIMFYSEHDTAIPDVFNTLLSLPLPYDPAKVPNAYTTLKVEVEI